MAYRMRSVKRIALFLTVLFWCFNVGTRVSADAYEGFSISIEKPENQIDSSVDYYDLMMIQGQKQELVLNIHNNGSEDMIAYIEVYNGSTGDNGTKQFSVKQVPDVSMKHQIEKLVAPKTLRVVVPARTTAQATLHVNAPQDTFEGIILGGIYVKADTVKNSEHGTTSGITISNRLSYVVGLQLRMNQNDVERNLNYIEAKPEVTNYLPSVVVGIQNDRAVLMNDVTITGNIFIKGTSEVVGIVEETHKGIMPNTQFNVVYNLCNKKINAGEYDVQLRIVHEDKTWEWNETLTIASEAASNINENAPFLEKDTNKWYLIIITALAGIILCLLLVLIVIFKKRKDEKI